MLWNKRKTTCLSLFRYQLIYCQYWSCTPWLCVDDHISSSSKHIYNNSTIYKLFLFNKPRKLLISRSVWWTVSHITVFGFLKLSLFSATRICAHLALSVLQQRYSDILALNLGFLWLELSYLHVSFFIWWELVIDVALQMNCQMWNTHDWSVNVN